MDRILQHKDGLSRLSAIVLTALSLFLLVVDLTAAIQDEGIRYIALFFYISFGLSISCMTTLFIIDRSKLSISMFDVSAGIIAPIFCLRYDVAVFIPDGILYMSWYPYIAIAVGKISFTAWILKRPLSRYWHGTIAGILLAGSLFAFLVGLVIAPYSLLGIGSLVSIFGLTPFLTTIAFFGNGKRSFAQVYSQLSQKERIGVIIPGILIILPLLIVLISRLLQVFI